jgi:hypothetical protein
MGSALQDQPLQSVPAQHTQSQLLRRKRPSLFKQVKKIDDKRAIILEFRVEVVGAFPDLGSVAERLEASSEISSSVGEGLRTVPGRKSRGEEMGFFSQEFSNRKQAARGIFVEAVTRRGTWSEVGRGREEREELGRAKFQA